MFSLNNLARKGLRILPKDIYDNPPDTEAQIVLASYLKLTCHFGTRQSAVAWILSRWLLLSVAYFTKEVNPRLAKCPLKTNGRLANCRLTSLVKEATGGPRYWLFNCQSLCISLNFTLSCCLLCSPFKTDSHFGVLAEIVKIIHGMLIIHLRHFINERNPRNLCRNFSCNFPYILSK